jgi:hypothetical protein
MELQQKIEDAFETLEGQKTPGTRMIRGLANTFTEVCEDCGLPLFKAQVVINPTSSEAAVKLLEVNAAEHTQPHPLNS